MGIKNANTSGYTALIFAMYVTSISFIHIHHYFFQQKIAEYQSIYTKRASTKSIEEIVKFYKEAGQKDNWSTKS